MERNMTGRLLIVAGLALAVSACGGFRDSLGLTKQSPDEFRVVSRAPLTLPPDYNLRPPEPGAPRPQVGSASQQAERAVFANSQNAAVRQQGTVARTAGEQALLVATGATERSEEHTSELQSLMRISYAVFCLKKNNKQHKQAKTE